MTQSTRRSLRATALVVATALGATTGAALALAQPAEAAAYRFWSYWTVPPDAGAWSFSRVGPTRRPPDGSVEGWRFAVSPSARTPVQPRLSAASTFDRVCGGTAAVDGRKRVALVVDFGSAADEPGGQSRPSDDVHVSCVVVPASANGYVVLDEAGYPQRIDGSMVCALAGYPRTGCGEPADEAAPAAPVSERPAEARKSKGKKATNRAAGAASKASRDGSGTSASTGSGAGGPARRSPSRSPEPPTGAKDESPSSAATTVETDGSAADGAGGDGTSDDATPAVVTGAPAAADGGAGGGAPAAALAGLVLAAALVGGGVLRARRSR